jgi:hypothetical protein
VLELGPFGFPPPNALVQAIPPAAASILAGFMASFGWREGWGRLGGIAEALKSERVKFTTRAAPDYAGEDAEAIGNFVARIEGLAAVEVLEWRTVVDRIPTHEPEAEEGPIEGKRPRPTTGGALT